MERNKVTVNGKSLSQIVEELGEPFPDSVTEKSQDGYLSIPIDAFEERLNRVVGIMNYNVRTSPGELVHVSSEDFAVFVNMTIEILSDGGEIVVTKSANGGAKCIVVNATGKPKGLKSDLEIATSEAFKNCGKKLGIGIAQMREYSRGRKGKHSAPQTDYGRKTTSSDTETSVFRIRFDSTINSGRSYYSARVTDLQTNKNCRFMLFEREVPEVEKRMALGDFIRKIVPGTEFHFVGTKNLFHGEEQVIFKRFAGKEA